ncbi:hypothetical protein R9C00_03290 [Flammeovirgaceae bacterium SG7u.111]|nr:hypothetical protein [Flammeovirgaceae bacterium SG7u.132]WPO36467.1 hypothetical protein R9C00_03290 [Flammeovirgaceae bacterium SG7u.111]
MNTFPNISPQTLVFSRWSRKSYAVFASLGKSIKIGKLSVEICRQATKTLESFISLLGLGEASWETGEEASEWKELSIQELELLQLVTVNTNTGAPKLGHSLIHTFIHRKPLRCFRSLKAFFMSKHECYFNKPTLLLTIDALLKNRSHLFVYQTLKYYEHPRT